MPAEFGDGSADGPPAVSAPRDVGRPAMSELYYEYAAYLYDYCEGILRNQAAAAGALRDTLVAAEAEIGKLRNPDQLRPWLYSIARRHCRRELPAAAGLPAAAEPPATGLPAAEPPGDDSADEQSGADADTGEIDVLDIEAEAREREILLVVTAALDGLSDRDREVLSLAFRHGFDGPDLAAALGLSIHSARGMLSGASARFEKSAAAVVVLRAAWAGCGVPDNIVGDWDPVWAPLTPKVRRRLSRHIGSCDTCSRISRYQAYGPEFLSLIPLAIPSAALRERIARSVFDAEPGVYSRALALRVGPLGGDGFPAQPPAWRTAPRVLAASAAVVVLVVAGALIHADGPTTAISPDAATQVGTGLPRLAEAGLPGAPAYSGSPAGRRRHGTRQEPALSPGALGLTPALDGVLPVPSRSPRPSPSHSRSPGSPSPRPSSPSPSPSPTTTSPSPSPSPTSSSPSPTPSPTTTSPSPTPSPSSSSPLPDPTTT